MDEFDSDYEEMMKKLQLINKTQNIPKKTPNVLTHDPATAPHVKWTPAEEILLKRLEERRQPKAPAAVEVTRYDDLDNCVVFTRNAPKRWTDAELVKIKVYKIEKLNINQILTKGQWFINQVNSLPITGTVADVCLELALHLGVVGSGRWVPMLKLLPDNIGYNIGWESPKVTGTSHQMTEDLVQRDRMVKLIESPEITESEKEDAKAVLDMINEKIKKASSGEQVDEKPLGLDEKDANAICYLAAYCLRLYGKTEATWINKLTLAKSRYTTWYDHESSIMQMFAPSNDQIRRLREAFNRKPELGSTWVLTAAYNENEPDLSKVHLGIITYLACQMFSYTGMHAYNFIVQLHAKSGVKFCPLLKQLDCPATRSSVIEASNIIRNFELLEGKEERTTYFRYARVFDAGYFSTLQTSNCVMLAYVTAKALQLLTPQAAGSNPSAVYALKDLDPALKDTLDGVAVKLYQFILKVSTIDKESGAIWRAGIEGSPTM